MEWLRTHAYISSASAVALLILLGGFIVSEKTAQTPATSQPNAFSGGGAVLNPTFYVPNSGSGGAGSNAQTPSVVSQVENSAPYTYIPPNSTITVGNTQNTTGSSFNFNAFIAMLSNENQPAAGSAGASGTSSISSAYAYVPSGLISTTSEKVTRTPLQQSLYDYGNSIGSFIQSYEEQHANSAQILTDQVQDRNDPQKIAAVEELGKSLTNLGGELLTIDDVPSQMSAAHMALAQSYQEIGQKLQLVPQAQSDQQFVAAIEAYDSAADTFTKNYVAVADLFASYGVVFSQSDPGSVFTFTNVSL